MKFFAPSVWKSATASIPAIGSVWGSFDKSRAQAPAVSGPSQPDIGKSNTGKSSAQICPKTGAVTYPLSPSFIRTFAMSGLPFMTFYEFGGLAGWHRDTYFAPDHVPGYAQDIGTRYTVWTHEATSSYRRHIFLDAISQDMTISFEVPCLTTASWFPLRIRIYDSAGLFFQHDQKLVVERLGEDGAALTSWKKIPALKASLPLLLPKAPAAV